MPSPARWRKMKDGRWHRVSPRPMRVARPVPVSVTNIALLSKRYGLPQNITRQLISLAPVYTTNWLSKWLLDRRRANLNRSMSKLRARGLVTALKMANSH